STVATSITIFCQPMNPEVVVKIHQCLYFWFLSIRFISKGAIHGKRIYYLSWIEYIFRIKNLFNFPNYLIILLSYHYRNKLSSHYSIAMFSGKRTFIFFAQFGYICGYFSKIGNII